MLGGASKVVWSASGDVLLPIEANRSASDGTDEEIAIPAVDQDGWVDGSGREFKGWSYKAVVTFKSAEGRTHQESVVFKALSGQSQIDLDLLPSSSPGVPSSGAIAVVTSLAGLTGAVTEEDLAGMGVGGGVPVSVIDEKDAATLEFAQKYTRDQIEANPGGVSEDVVDQKIETAIGAIPAGVTEEAVDAKITAAVEDIPVPDVDLATVDQKDDAVLTQARAYVDEMLEDGGGGGTPTPTTGVSYAGAAELQPWTMFGHSWHAEALGNNTPGMMWWERVKSRLRMGVVTNRGVAGRTMGDISNLTLGGSRAWVPRTKNLVSVLCTINDVTLFDGSDASLRGYEHATRALLSQVTANAAVASNTTSFVYSPGWTSEAASGTSASTQGATTHSTGGTRWKTTTPGAYFEFTFTGPDCDVYLVARAAGAGVVTFTEGAVARGSLDLTATVGQDCIAVHRIRGAGGGMHTIRGTLTSGASLTVDSYRIPSAAPVPVVVFGESEVVPAPTDHVGYWADVERFKERLQVVVGEFPTATYVELDGPDWDVHSMLVTDSNGGKKHANDGGNSYIADIACAEFAEIPFERGLHFTTHNDYPAAYSVPLGPLAPEGGVDGTGAAAVPLVLPSGATSDYRGSTLGTPGSAVTSWADNGSAGSALAPAGTAPVVREGAFKYAEFTSAGLRRDVTIAYPATVLVVCRLRPGATLAGQYVLESSQVLRTSATGMWMAQSGGNTLISSAAAVAGEWVVLGVVYQAGTATLSVSGANYTGSLGTSAASGTTYVGRNIAGSSFGQIDVARIVTYSKALTGSELATGIMALRSEYGL